MDHSDISKLYDVDMSHQVNTIIFDLTQHGTTITPSILFSAAKAYSLAHSFSDEDRLRLYWWCTHAINNMRRKSDRVRQKQRNTRQHLIPFRQHTHSGKDAAGNQGEDDE